MSISDADYKVLWGRAAGHCSNATCRKDLTVLLKSGEAYNLGEMAHIIARSPAGPRGSEAAGTDAYENLILLCPTCHRTVDKAPAGTFTEEILRSWKASHERAIRERGLEKRFESTKDLKDAISKLLSENYLVWREFGPNSAAATTDPGSNLYLFWNMRKLDTIVPNNWQIINLIEANRGLVSGAEYELFLGFKNHARAFEAHQHARLDDYPRFPRAFEEAFRS